MHQAATLMPGGGTSDDGLISAALPTDLLDQVRRRVRVLSLLLLVGFGIDLAIWFLRTVWAAATGSPELLVLARPTIFLLGTTLAALSSLALWWVAGEGRVSATRLLHLGLFYEILICLVIATTTYSQQYRELGVIPHLTWVPVVVIMFPMLLPGPPVRVAVGAAAAAAMSPVSLLLLEATERIAASSEDYVVTIVASGIAILFAYVAARVVYGLGRDVAEARRAGSYRLERKLGEGGMGEVWLASHGMLARPAAIKLIGRSSDLVRRSGSPSAELAQRFEREAQTIASLRSPHTIHLFDFGVADGGAFYYAMELLEGLDGNALVRRFGPVPADRAIHLLGQVCHSLSEAHSSGLVHRDVKPANIFLCRYGEEVDFVKVLDFGIVKEVGLAANDPALTHDEMIRGTPAFLAPEQAMGSLELDGRSDLYAVGCLAYWFLTGQYVFEADTALALLMHHLESVPEPPSSRTEMRISSEFDRLILSCLAKVPGDRPASARELALGLLALPEAGGWTERRAHEWWELHQPSGAPAKT